ncbi:hypothetical protein ACSBR2_015554 [Camellia fascicularis]
MDITSLRALGFFNVQSVPLKTIHLQHAFSKTTKPTFVPTTQFNKPFLYNNNNNCKENESCNLQSCCLGVSVIDSILGESLSTHQVLDEMPLSDTFCIRICGRDYEKLFQQGVLLKLHVLSIEPMSKNFYDICLRMLLRNQSKQVEENSFCPFSLNRGTLFLIIALAFAINGGDAQNSTTLVPSILTFGDSAVDVGNNDHIHTISKLISHLMVETSSIINQLEDHLILGEEGGLIGNSSSDYLWCIDPSGRTCRRPYVSEYTHVFYSYWWGAFCNWQKIQVSHIDKVEQSLLVIGFGYEHDDAWSTNIELFKEFTDASRGVRRHGVTAVDMCHVALGIVEAYWEYRLKPWDMVAGVLVTSIILRNKSYFFF